MILMIRRYWVKCLNCWRNNGPLNLPGGRLERKSFLGLYKKRDWTLKNEKEL